MAAGSRMATRLLLAGVAYLGAVRCGSTAVVAMSYRTRTATQPKKRGIVFAAVGALALATLGPETVSGEGMASLPAVTETEILSAGRPDICPGATLLQHDDGVFEMGYAWEGWANEAPYWGAWAECYDAEYVCGLEFLFSRAEAWPTGRMDVFVWADDGAPPPENNPGAVICVVTGVDVGEVAFWPQVSVHPVQVCCLTGGSHFVGFWGRWHMSPALWYIVADVNGPAGCPRTNVHPGYSWWGWQDVSEIFGPAHSLGIREYGGWGDCVPSPAVSPTWGAIKTLFR